MQTVVCMRWGNLFAVDYVNRLYRSVMRHVVRPTRFVAFTDDVSGLDSGIETRDIPPIRLPETGLGGSPWRKLALWSPHIDIEGDMLFLDLDVVIVGGLDVFFDYEPGKLVLMRDPRAKITGNSSIMRLPPRAAPHLIKNFEADPLGKRQRYENEQVYLNKESGLPTAFWPKEWTPSFKADILPRFPLNWIYDAEIPADARVVVFTGHPRPHEALRGEWPAKGWKKIYKHVRPVRWLKDHWVEDSRCSAFSNKDRPESSASSPLF